MTTYCVSCGIALAPRIAFRHMEKCWAKVGAISSQLGGTIGTWPIGCTSIVSGEGKGLLITSRAVFRDV